MSSPLSDLGLSIPVIAAPMAGGPTTPAIVIAAHNVGGTRWCEAASRLDVRRWEARVLGRRRGAMPTRRWRRRP